MSHIPKWFSVSQYLHHGIDAHIFPNADLLVCQRGKIIFKKRSGKTIKKTSRGVREQPLQQYYDLASLTKPLCTAFLFMLATQNGDIELDDPLSYYFITKNLKTVTIRQLLNHTSGLVDWVDYFGKNNRAVREPPLQDILNNPKRLRKSQETLYSDLGYIVLGSLLERKYKKSLDEIFIKKISEPLNLTHELFFTPLKKKRLHKKSELYPSEFCERRGKIIQGEVMDENAWVMGGVAGHAGLFGTAHSVHKILNELRLAKHGKSKLIAKKTFHEFCQPNKNRKWTEHSFTLGFDTPTTGKSQSGKCFSKNSIGHLGYSGTSFWWDLDKDFWVILLTNRCYPLRENKKISEFRPRLHDLVLNTICRQKSSAITMSN